MLDYVAAAMACHGSVRSGRVLKPEEINALSRQMEATPARSPCHYHRQPPCTELKLTDIEHLGRRR